MFRARMAALAATLMVAACGSASTAASTGPATGPREAGTIKGWTGGDATLYATVGFFAPNPEIVAVGAVTPDGSFSVVYPATLPADVLSRPAEQCSTIQATDPAARTAFTANDVIYQHGAPVAAIHSGTSLGVAAFTGIMAGDTRTGYVYADRPTTTSGFCERRVSFGGHAVDFLQNLDLPLHQGWNQVVADFSTPAPGQVVSDLTVGSNRAGERFFLFRPAMPR